MAVSHWYDACKQIMPAWLQTKIDDKASLPHLGDKWIELRIGPRMHTMIVRHELDAPVDIINRVVAESLRGWLVTMRDKCNAELGEEHVPRGAIRSLEAQLDALQDQSRRYRG